MSGPAEALGNKTIIKKIMSADALSLKIIAGMSTCLKKILVSLVVSRKHVLSSEKLLRKPQGPRS